MIGVGGCADDGACKGCWGGEGRCWGCGGQECVKDEISRELTKEVKDMVDQDPGRDADKMIEEVAKVIFLWKNWIIF